MPPADPYPRESSRPFVLPARNGVLGHRVARRLSELGHFVLVHPPGAPTFAAPRSTHGGGGTKTDLPIVEFPPEVLAAARTQW